MNNKTKDISIDVGSGVPKIDIPTSNNNIVDTITLQNGKSIDRVKEYDINDRFIHNDVNNKTHWNKPFFKGQSRTQGMYKLSHPKVRLFQLSEPQSVEDYNAFLAQLGGEGDDPQIANLTLDKQFHNGSFIILATYNEVWYILPDQK